MNAGIAAILHTRKCLWSRWIVPLTPVWTGVLQRGIAQADRADAKLLVIELNTPGGGVELMNKLVQQILASPVPVAVFVSPRGGMAASAGTLIVLAGQVAAMTPESAIGAASPIGLQGEDLETTAEVKAKEILKASVRSLAARRGEAAVRLAESAIESQKQPLLKKHFSGTDRCGGQRPVRTAANSGWSDGESERCRCCP